MTGPEGAFRAALVALALLSVPALAQDAALLPEDAHADWTAIGRLNVGGYRSRGMCTATLIAPDTVLTAAHCVLGPRGEPIPPERLRFVAGWFRGEFAALAGVAGVTGAGAFGQAMAAGRIDIPGDRAILTLSEPVLGVPPLPLAPFDLSRPARLIGYRWDRPHALSDTGDCPATLRDRVLTMTCPATFGNSGGPVLQLQDGAWRVVAVVSSINGTLTFAPLAE